MSILESFGEVVDNVYLPEATILSVLTAIMEDDDNVDDDDRAGAAVWLHHIESNSDRDTPELLGYDHYGLKIYSIGGNEYAVGTEDEADSACHDYIEQSVWAFNASFLAGETGIDQSVFEALADKCEGANDAVLSIINGSCGLDDFVETAVGADGRGHFLSPYDGEENEVSDFYIYRVN